MNAKRLMCWHNERKLKKWEIRRMEKYLKRQRRFIAKEEQSLYAR